MKRKKWWKIWLGVALCAAVAVGIPAALLFEGIIHFNRPSRLQYPVRGVDVSAYQGAIDWATLAQQDIDFAFIKATEGSTFVDRCFADNWQGANETSLLAGAYHFFSYDSSGGAQARNFIQTVPKQNGMLPPVVDVEFYGDKERNLPIKEDVQKELEVLLGILEEHYGAAPILYATEKSYALYIADAFPDSPIWIRGIFYEPTLPDGRAWTFWQYTNRARLRGYEGTERFIDMNAFSGDKEKLRALALEGAE